MYIQAAGASASNNYQWMYWDGLAGSTDYTTSAPVTVPSGGGATGVNMTLQRGGTVVATFVDAVTGNPVQGIGLLLYPGSACNTQNLPSFPGSAGSNQISVYGVPPGTVYVRPWTNDSSLSYIFPWWNGGDGSGTMNCSEAVGIPVQVGQTAGPLNYRLTLGGKITGTVTNGQGAPVANMNLYAFTGSPCGQTTQAAYAYTNQSGEYSLVVPAGSAYSVKVYDYNTRTYVPLWWDGTAGSSNCANAQVVAATSGGTTPGINFTMQPGGSIVGTVKDAANQGIAGVTVQVYDARGFYINQVTTDAQGAYTVTGVTPGLALVYANGTSNSLNYLRKWWDGGTGDINRYRATAVTVAASTPTTGLNFVLEPGGTVGGTITDHTGAPLAGISIRAYAGAPMNSIGNFASATTNASGAYTLRGMPAQTFIEANIGSSGINAVSAWWNGSGGVFGPFNARPLAVAPGATLSGIDMQLAQGGVIEGRITNGTGTGLPGVSVAAFMEMACSPSQASSATTDADGEFTLVGVPAGKAHVAGSGGNYIPTWWNGAGGAAKYADSAAVTVVAGQTVSDVTVPLPLGGAISGTVLDAGGHPLYGVILSTVSQACASVPPATGYSAVSYADGTFTLGGVPAGATYVKTSPALRRTDHAVTWYDGGHGDQRLRRGPGRDRRQRGDHFRRQHDHAPRRDHRRDADRGRRGRTQLRPGAGADRHRLSGRELQQHGPVDLRRHVHALRRARRQRLRRHLRGRHEPAAAGPVLERNEGRGLLFPGGRPDGHRRHGHWRHRHDPAGRGLKRRLHQPPDQRQQLTSADARGPGRVSLGRRGRGLVFWRGRPRPPGPCCRQRRRPTAGRGTRTLPRKTDWASHNAGAPPPSRPGRPGAGPGLCRDPAAGRTGKSRSSVPWFPDPARSTGS